ncbi:hypothetical protein [Isoptericola sp. NPDC055881]
MVAKSRQREAGYVLDIFDELLGTAGSREHRFDWLRGDPGRSGQRVRLPVDSYWPEHKLVVEVYERQHDEPVRHFDKPDRLTVSGVHRGEQRRIYDERRRSEIPAHGLVLLVVRTAELACTGGGRLIRDQVADKLVIGRLLASVGVAPHSSRRDDREL